jgi:hypothetical protein
MRFAAKFALVALGFSAWARAESPLQQHSPQGCVTMLTASEIASRMEERGRARASALHQFESSRVYHLEYRGFGGNKEAEMKVRMNFRAPATKTFTVISEDGSKFIIEHVFDKLLESEQEAVTDQNRMATALTLQNYDFALAGCEKQKGNGAEMFVLDVKPRSRNKFLYEGRIWVDGEDFAVTRIDAVPVKNPSFWIKQTEVEHTYTKVDSFWLPAQNRSESHIRFGGIALLTIDYNDYRINSAGDIETAAMTASSSSDRPNGRKAKKAGKPASRRQFGASDAALADALNIPK